MESGVNVADSVLTAISLCSGVGMLDVGLGLGFEHIGYRIRHAAYCEREAYAVSQLLALMEAGCLDEAPVWTDLTTFPARQFHGLVDILIAGLPCQPYSVAGKQRGNDDHRSWGDGDGPIPHALRIIDEMRPTMVFLENVPAWVMGGHFRRFGEELSRLGYRIESPIFIAASDVGASHKRERVFILAYSESRRLGELRQPSGSGGFADGRDEELGNARLQHGNLQQRQVWSKYSGADRAMADAESLGRGIRQRDEQPRRTEAESASHQLANTRRSSNDAQQQICIEERDGSARACGIGDELAHASSSRHEGRELNGTHVANERTNERTNEFTI